VQLIVLAALAITVFMSYKTHRHLLLPEIYLSIGKTMLYLALAAWLAVDIYRELFYLCGAELFLFPICGLECIANATKTYEAILSRKQHALPRDVDTNA